MYAAALAPKPCVTCYVDPSCASKILKLSSFVNIEALMNDEKFI